MSPCTVDLFGQFFDKLESAIREHNEEAKKHTRLRVSDAFLYKKLYEKINDVLSANIRCIYATEENKQAPICKINGDVFVKIASYLKTEEIVQCRKVCTWFKGMCDYTLRQQKKISLDLRVKDEHLQTIARLIPNATKMTMKHVFVDTMLLDSAFTENRIEYLKMDSSLGFYDLLSSSFNKITTLEMTGVLFDESGGEKLTSLPRLQHLKLHDMRGLQRFSFLVAQSQRLKTLEVTDRAWNLSTPDWLSELQVDTLKLDICKGLNLSELKLPLIECLYIKGSNVNSFNNLSIDSVKRFKVNLSGFKSIDFVALLKIFPNITHLLIEFTGNEHVQLVSELVFCIAGMKSLQEFTLIDAKCAQRKYLLNKMNKIAELVVLLRNVRKITIILAQGTELWTFSESMPSSRQFDPEVYSYLTYVQFCCDLSCAFEAIAAKRPSQCIMFCAETDDIPKHTKRQNYTVIEGNIEIPDFLSDEFMSR